MFRGMGPGGAFSTFELKPKHVFWGVWYSPHECFRGCAPIAYGFERTPHLAASRALDEAGPNALQLPSQLAERFWRKFIWRIRQKDRVEIGTRVLTPPAHPIPPSVHPCLQFLGLPHAATVIDVRSAFRQRVIVVHPDQGGDHQQFIQLKAAYDEALALVESG